MFNFLTKNNLSAVDGRFLIPHSPCVWKFDNYIFLLFPFCALKVCLKFKLIYNNKNFQSFFMTLLLVSHR